jgi:class 3 adenylate cyclase/uncharacterized protein (DUF427 family)
MTVDADDMVLTPAEIDGYQIDIEVAAGRIAALIDGVVIAESDNTQVLRETFLKPGIYFPRQDVNQRMLQRSEFRTFCPFKGTASHWSIRRPDGSLAENTAWSYERPLSIGIPLADHFGFYDNAIDEWLGDDHMMALLDEEPVNHPGSFALANWVITEAWTATDAADLTERLAEKLLSSGMPLMRMNIGIWTLHPQLINAGYNWHRDHDGIAKSNSPRGILQSEAYLKSPVRYVTEGLGGARQRLDVANPEFPFPIMAELRDQGMTDYVAMPLGFSDGQINSLTMATDHPDGFNVANLGQFYLALPMLSRLYEVFTLRDDTSALLETYLGERTGTRVLNGLTQRGDGESIHAVIWFCDLRGSSALADSLPRAEFLEDLNRFFDAMAGAVLDHGGEVLRFIGDAVLAIFPTAEEGVDKLQPGPASRTAGTIARTCYTALDAVREAEHRMADFNKTREEEGKQALGYGIGLHLGELTYGNIGTPERLEFTVIGAAANEAARIEDLCKELDTPVLISDTFADAFPEQLVSKGSHRLRGVDQPMDVYTLQE